MFLQAFVAVFWCVAFGLSPVCQGAQFAYVTSSDSVWVIDTATNATVATVPVKGADGLAIDPAGAFVYVTASDLFSSSISVLDVGVNRVVGSTQLSGVTHQVAVHPSGRYVYALHREPQSAHPFDGWVSVIDTSTRAITNTIHVPFAVALAVNPGYPRAYVATQRSIIVVDTMTNAVMTEVFVGSALSAIATNPAGTFLYVVDRGQSTVVVIDTATNAVVKVIPVGDAWGPLQFNASGTVAYVSTAGYSIAAIDTASNTVIATMPLGPFGTGTVRGVALSPDGTTLYASVLESGSIGLDRALKVIDTATRAVVARLSLAAAAIAVKSDGSAYVAGNFDTVWVVSGASHNVTGRVPVMGYSRSIVMGPVVAATPSDAATPIPTLSEWSMMAMGLLLGMLGMSRLRA